MSPELSQDVQQQVARGVAILRQGRIVAYPTDTVYGLGAGMYSRGGVERVFKVKQRPGDMALPLLVADMEQVAGLAGAVPEAALRLAERFLPGALTLVLPAGASVPQAVTAGGDTVAVRIPDHPVPIALIRGIGGPMVGTSANLSGSPSPLSAGEVHAQLGDSVDLVVDDGHRCGGRESTIVDVTGDRPVLLREGAICRQEIRRIVELSD